MEEVELRKMQVKVLYSFNDNPTVFLSRSTQTHQVKIAQVPINDDEYITLGGFDLKTCLRQILKTSPENFQLQALDYAVYYKDVTEQPDEPFVSHGNLSDVLQDPEHELIPGRVCQNVSASVLFGKKLESASLTLEVRLKLHTLEKEDNAHKRPTEEHEYVPQKAQKQSLFTSQSLFTQRPSHYSAPVKATRTKSLPAFSLYNNHMYSVRNADKHSAPSRYDLLNVLDRFKLAPFVDAQVIAKPKVLRRSRVQHRGTATRTNSMVEPVRAVRTRSMITGKQTPLMISSPIHEEGSSDTDDTEYNDQRGYHDNQDLDSEMSPYTPRAKFQSLPDLEDLDSKKTHAIQGNKLPEDHGLVCVNPNCVTEESILWRFFEIDFNPSYFEIRNSKEFDKKNYDGMFGPLCNACYLFLRNKGFMRPEAVVKKYLKQQRYKKELKEREERDDADDKNNKRMAPRKHIASSPLVMGHKFATPNHTPSEINQVIQNSKNQDLNDFINQLNNYGGPLTDIDPLPQDLQGVTPPMMATKSNTRVINIDQEDKENCPPVDVNQFHNSNSPTRNGTTDFEKLIVNSFNHAPPSQRSSPIDNDWMNSLFGGPTPKDQATPGEKEAPDSAKRRKNLRVSQVLPQLKTFTTRRSPRLNKHKKQTTTNMPSSPLLASKSSSDDKLNAFLDDTHLDMIEDELRSLAKHHPNYKDSHGDASRNDTSNLVLSLYQKRLEGHSSSPSSDIFSDDYQKRHESHESLPHKNSADVE